MCVCLCEYMYVPRYMNVCKCTLHKPSVLHMYQQESYACPYQCQLLVSWYEVKVTPITTVATHTYNNVMWIQGRYTGLYHVILLQKIWPTLLECDLHKHLRYSKYFASKLSCNSYE